MAIWKTGEELPREDELVLAEDNRGRLNVGQRDGEYVWIGNQQQSFWRWLGVTRWMYVSDLREILEKVEKEGS